MVDDAQLLVLVAGFYKEASAGNIERMAEYIAEDVTVINGDQRTASNRDELLASIRAGADAGWTAQRLLSVGVKDSVAAGVYENVFADGSTSVGAGAMLFNDAGKICQIRTVTAGRLALVKTA